MSYILEALRRAESQRLQGQVPSVHSPTAAGQSGATPTGRALATKGTPRLAALALGTVVLMLTIWWFWQGMGGASKPAMTPPPVEPVQGPRLAEPPRAPPPVDRPQAMAQVPAPPLPQATTAASAPRMPPPPKLTLGHSGPEAGSLRKWTAMTEAERQQWPRIQLGGSMYSEDRAARMLVVNDQVVREGAQVSAGLTLEQIGPRAAIFSFRGQRVQLDY